MTACWLIIFMYVTCGSDL